LTQNLLEPVLLKYAGNNGFTVRFDTKLLTFEEGEEDENKRKIRVTVEDLVSGFQYDIRTKYLFGADGGRSTVAKILDLPFTSIPGGGFAYNVLLRADLKHLMQYQQGNLHVCMRMLKDHPFLCVARMV
jgi:2-polyprenyl-6-methoxyphenol hydroxylase-like FAD-dependent oxidoreductase